MTETQKVAHLLRRFGFGASEQEMEYYGKDGLAGAIEKLLNFEGVEELDIDPTTLDKNGVANMRHVQTAWFLRMITTRRPLEEKVALFWHHHFATSGQKVTQAPMMHQQVQTLRAKGFGRFEHLLLALAQDPAMIFWLDNQENLKGKPNENFAREVMELFTLGVGHYTEKDVQEAARAFTGWRFRRVKGQRLYEFYLDQRQHDNDLKTVLGQTSKLSGDDICAILASMPQTSRHVARKMWEWFGYDNPDDGLIDRMAAAYRKGKMETKAILRAMMEAPEFYSEQSQRGLVKNPVDFVIAPLRQIGLGEVVRTALADTQDRRIAQLATFARVSTKGMGMDLLFPPDVNGWDPSAAGWISSATMIERIKFGANLFLGRNFAGSNPGVLAVGDVTTTKELAKRMNEILDARIPEVKLINVEKAADTVLAGKPLNSKTAPPVAAAAARLIFGAPDYQFN
ncbi:MAG: DUF1800 domain-containing protein [Chthonomonas sp.]|nr:DUF1800 domain-containing protein [Chthonomonas sp.]